MTSTRTGAAARPWIWIAGGVVPAAVLLLGACTASERHETPAGASAPPGSRTAAPRSGRTPTEQAEAALAAVGSGALVEAGTERVADGIHPKPVLSAGRRYRLDLVCVGRGGARVAFTPAGAGTKATVPCDRSVVWQRITPHGHSRNSPVHIDVDGAKGSTGVISWAVREVV
ncbi:hypothetical protein ABZ876_22430 [Streptomyces sp. NPDC046931]|uniref:hypothetical protein n=1 Tax=Streptomyces sp. NPDC046931 TaxID=3154806 RepID=UPI0033FEAC83